ncbi:amino acid adenylation domain-containing protein [Methylomagnum ishizawai]|uniref:Amino acid adenylation domain-containing protein n=1 Tax=Methylomagnum ishizawai TaxID=1760988 RepID=A0A1Y6D3H1_9GAMM|nr:amino acid adenylation domain-containing protein [Methylomagnum ishizawai]
MEADIDGIDPHRPLNEQGIDSLISMDLAARIERATGVKLSPAIIEELGTVTALAERVAHATSQEAALPPPATTTATALPDSGTSIRVVKQATPGLLDGLQATATTLPAPGPGQVQIRVHAAGLNFRDLMIALDSLPEARGEPLGLEFCGEIQALGANVEGFEVGQRVFGLAPGAMAAAVNVNADLLAPAPADLNDAECAALPVAYLTALRCLELPEFLPAPRRSILIHAATGGLGQATLRLAQAAGMDIFATAGSPDKRAWLEAQGVAKAMDSRRLDFADEILVATQGRGVDLVLNSLTGAAVDRGLACLAAGGVFIEVGKTDLRDPADIALRHPSRHYRIYDLVAEIRTQPAQVGRWLRALGERIAQGGLPPLPVETFALDAARNAFQQMARARHRGKIVLLAEPPTRRKPTPPPDIDAPVADFPLAVVGYSGRFPGAEDCAALWEVLRAGRPVTGTVPAGRWSQRELALFSSGLPDPARLQRGGFLVGAEDFDAAGFGFSPREARATDPRQRLLLEETWRALHAAGLDWSGPGASLRPANIGMFVAADAGDYGFKRATAGARGDQLALAGNLPSSLAARLAHVFDCAGPALTLDLSCSASLGALWAARQALAQGDCHCAVVAAVSLHSTPMLASQLAAADLLSARGQSLPFTVEADGLVPAEACVALVVKPLAQAQADGDAIHAVLRGIGVAHDGSGRGFTLPDAGHLADLYAATLDRAGVSAEQIDLISAHGVGMRGGDAAEITALTRTFAAVASPRPLTTAKPLLGHTLAAAGLTALVHAILQLRHQRLLPVGLAGRSLIPEWDATRFHVPAEPTAWPARPEGQPRRVLLNTFAINGGLGAAIVEDAPPGTAPAMPFPRLPARQLQRRRFWPELDTGPGFDPDPVEPTPAETAADGLREELGELLQEAPERLDLEADPVALGLSSVLAIELQHRLRRRYGLELGLDEILGVARLADLLPRLAEGGVPLPTPSVPPDDAPHAPFPLTALQAAYWSGRQPDVPLGGTDCQVYWEFECAKPWPVADLEAAWNRLVAAHPMLRAVIDGDARQRVLGEVPAYRFEVLDLADAPDAAQQRQNLRDTLATAAIDPGVWPLFRIAVSRVGNSQRLHCALNLLVMDVLSLYSLLDELALLADSPAATCASPAVSFRQCVQAVRDAAEGEAWRKAESFWAARGPRLPPAPDLPMTQPLGHLGRLSTRRFQTRLTADAWRGIAAEAKQRGHSASVAFLAVFAATLAHWTRSPHFTLNLTTHTRPPLHPEVNRVVGNFTGTVLLDVAVEAGQPFRALAARVGSRLREHLGQTAYPGVQVLRRRAAALGWDAGLMPVVFTSMLGYESLRSGGKTAAAPLIGSLIHGATRTPQVTLDAQVQADAEGVLLSWDVAEGVFPEGLPEAMFAAWTEAARALAEAAGWEEDIPARIARHEAAVRAIANADTSPIPDEALYAPFLRQAAAHPDRSALIAPGRSLSYGELVGQCAGLAIQLRALGARPGALVAVAMEKGWRQVMAAIAVQMAGAAYLPLAVDLPAARFQQLVERGEVRIALTEAGRTLAWPAGVEVVAIDERGPEPGDPADLPPVDPDSLAYVIFTSGSTGEPKGVMLSHRAALNTCLDINRRFALGPEDRGLALSALSFDLSVWDIFGMLAAGAALVLPRPASANDPAYLAGLMREQRITVWNSVPMYLELFLAGEPAPTDVAALRVAMLSGDWIALGLAGRLRAVAPAARVHSLGGATEAAIWSIHHPIEDAPRPGWPSVPYGRALDNQTMQVLDADLQPCPDGVAGDLYIGGIGLALGYWRDPERTAAAFIVHPANGERLYRTGDLARWREAGLLEFLGRRDGQVKIDGFRVELGEIEAVLRTHPVVREAVAVAPADGQGRRRLAAFCLLDADTSPAVLLDHLRSRLPAYMIPKELRILDRLPLNDNEKIDRRALAEWAFRAGTEPPVPTAAVDAGELERRLTALWGDIIGEARGTPCVPDPRRNLFELGADSLMAVVASRRIVRDLGVSCTVTEIFSHATIARLAKALAERMPRAAVPPVSAVPSVASAAPPVRADRRRAFRSRLD